MKSKIFSIISPIGVLFFSGLTGEESSANAASNYFDVVKVFQSCPLIYISLLILSIVSLTIWLYSMLTVRASELMPNEFLGEIKRLFAVKEFDNALLACQTDDSAIAAVIGAGIQARHYGPQFVVESMKSEGKRAGNSLWQRISLLNEIAVLAPMLGLLGTVVGLFWAFYDSSRTPESIAAIFDGLGVAVGTTVLGLVVSILSMIFYTTLKFRVVGIMTAIENESLALVPLIDMQTGKTS